MLADTQDSQPQAASEEPLKDKVILLYDGTVKGGQSLALSLAERGADVALVYRPAHQNRAEDIKNAIEAQGQRCLIMLAQPQGDKASQALIQKTVDELGRLDIYIDYSSGPSGQSIADQSAGC